MFQFDTQSRGNSDSPGVGLTVNSPLVTRTKVRLYLEENTSAGTYIVCNHASFSHGWSVEGTRICQFNRPSMGRVILLACIEPQGRGGHARPSEENTVITIDKDSTRQ